MSVILTQAESTFTVTSSVISTFQSAAPPRTLRSISCSTRLREICLSETASPSSAIVPSITPRHPEDNQARRQWLGESGRYRSEDRKECKESTRQGRLRF
eukprot:TRINITY_DN1446_c0_g3_i1.p1 TRINITY_DN1446_c0_g3~~TRINITY_DN1446_c0_g3_i1.p1  ORF type:complete len:100 (+),score=0.48 TRINITY_DN1446_c0_g3_i1:59-358(+)